MLRGSTKGCTSAFATHPLRRRNLFMNAPPEHNRVVPNLLKRLETIRINGHGFRRVFQLPPAVFSRVDVAYNGLCSLILYLDRACKTHDWNLVRTTLATLARRMFEFGNQFSDANEEHRQNFILLGGPSVLLQVLHMPKKSGLTERTYIGVINDIMHILRELCISRQSVADTLLQREWIIHLFSLLTGGTFETALALMEEVLATCESCFDLSLIPDISRIVSKFAPRQLASFCRLMSLVVFDNSRLMGKVGNKAEDLLRPAPAEVSPIDKNHALLINIPNFLSRLVQFLDVSPTCLSQSRPDFDSPRLDAISLLAALDDRDDSWDSLSVDYRAAAEGRATETQQLKIMGINAHLVEVLFVLSSLLSSRRKLDVRKQLFKLGIVSKLTAMFDQLDWIKFERPDPDLPPIHGPGCDCNPLSALRIQFLRVVHGLCDVDYASLNCKTAKLLMMRNILPPCYDRSDSISVVSLRSEGLIGKLARVHVQQAFDSPFRFWMSSCLEAFLRSSDFSDQVYVAESGVVEHVLEELLSPLPDAAKSHQSNLDLLSELVKFNFDIVLRVEQYLCQGDRWERFCQIVMNQLVDSNVLVRALLLTFEFMDTCSTRASESRLLRPFVVDNRLSVLTELMSVVSITEVAQENVCCINTALLFFLAAQRRGILLELLQSVRESEMTPGIITMNFVQLLEYWQRYYLHRGRDCAAIEFSSTIRFSEWRNLVQLLTADATSPLSLRYGVSL